MLASVIEAVIGACYLHAGYERTAAAVVEAFQPEIEHALEHPVDFKSTLQERLARAAATVELRGHRRARPAARPHVRGRSRSVDGRPVGTGSGRSKKHAEQEAARAALETLDTAHEAERRGRGV